MLNDTIREELSKNPINNTRNEDEEWRKNQNNANNEEISMNLSMIINAKRETICCSN